MADLCCVSLDPSRPQRWAPQGWSARGCRRPRL